MGRRLSRSSHCIDVLPPAKVTWLVVLGQGQGQNQRLSQRLWVPAPTGEFIFFACTKKTNQKKYTPDPSAYKKHRLPSSLVKNRAARQLLLRCRAAVDIANDEGILMLFIRNWLRDGTLLVTFLLL